MVRTKITSRRQVCHDRRQKVNHYRPQKVKLSEILQKTSPSCAPRVIHVQDPFYDQLLLGDKLVEARPYYPCFRDLSPGQLVEFSHRSSGSSFVVRITRKRIFRSFAAMLRKESIRSCLPHHDRDDLQRAVNTYRSFRNGAYKLFERKYGVMALRFTHVEDDTPKNDKFDWGQVQYDKNSLCSIFDTWERVRREREFPPKR